LDNIRAVTMAAAQVAKKLKDKRQKRTMEEIFKKVDKDGNGSISLSEYFGIFEEHGIVVNKTETNRVIRLAGDDGNLTKESFIKILKSSDFFMKAFDKNKDGIVTETEMMTRAELAFHALDKDHSGYVTEKELKKLSKKLSTNELKSLMTKLDSDGDGRLSFEEFRVLFENAERRKAAQEKPSAPPPLPAQLKARHNSVQAKSSCSRHGNRMSHHPTARSLASSPLPTTLSAPSSLSEATSSLAELSVSPRGSESQRQNCKVRHQMVRACSTQDPQRILHKKSDAGGVKISKDPHTIE